MNQLVINLKNLLPLGILLAFLAAIGHSDEGQATAKAADAKAAGAALNELEVATSQGIH